MRRKGRGPCFLFLLVAVGLSELASPQTIRPVRSEYRLHADGSFQLVNDSFVPLNVVLETLSFAVSEKGEISYRPLDPGIVVKFSETSFRLPPKQTHTVAYAAQASILPACFVIYAGMTAAPVRLVSGMNLTIRLPHTVYILPKKDATRAEVSVSSVKYHPADGKVRIQVVSESSLFARVLATEVVGEGARAEGDGFPLFPKSRRELEIDWRGPARPERVIVRFEKFKIEEPISTQ